MSLVLKGRKCDHIVFRVIIFGVCYIQSGELDIDCVFYKLKLHILSLKCNFEVKILSFIREILINL